MSWAFPAARFLPHFNRARCGLAYYCLQRWRSRRPRKSNLAGDSRTGGRERGRGHGVKAVEDRALMDFSAQQRIGIESRLTSNILRPVPSVSKRRSSAQNLPEHMLASL